MNIIENCWAYLKQRVKGRAEKFANNEAGRLEYEKLIREEWHSVPDELIYNLYSSLPDRMQNVIDCQGNLGKY